MTMCGLWAYESWLEYAEVFPEIADILNASKFKATVKDNKDRNGLIVIVSFDGCTGQLNDGERDNWSIIDLGGEIVELDIPVQNRDARAIASAVLKAIQFMNSKVR
jgi:hypothetical protein